MLGGQPPGLPGHRVEARLEDIGQAAQGAGERTRNTRAAHSSRPVRGTAGWSSVLKRLATGVIEAEGESSKCCGVHVLGSLLRRYRYGKQTDGPDSRSPTSDRDRLTSGMREYEGQPNGGNSRVIARHGDRHPLAALLRGRGRGAELHPRRGAAVRGPAGHQPRHPAARGEPEHPPVRADHAPGQPHPGGQTAPGSGPRADRAPRPDPRRGRPREPADRDGPAQRRAGDRSAHPGRGPRRLSRARVPGPIRGRPRAGAAPAPVRGDRRRDRARRLGGPTGHGSALAAHPARAAGAPAAGRTIPWPRRTSFRWPPCGGRSWT